MVRRRESSPDRDFMIGGRYERILKLGQGTFGKVYKARDRITGDTVALKKCLIQMDLEGVPPTTIREVSLLKVLGRSNHVVKLLGAEPVDEDGKAVLYLVFEYVQQDLKQFMGADEKRQHLPVPKSRLKPFMFQLLRGVAFMHRHGIMHRDLKPQNLLVDSRAAVLKIADLGLGRLFSMPAKAYTHEVVTLWYRAPEILLGSRQYALPVDTWSVGCIFAEMAKGPPLFPSDCEFAQLLTIFQILGTPNEDTWPGVTQLKDWHLYPQWQAVDMHALMGDALDASGVDLLLQLLHYDPDRRISARRALQHPWFDDLDREAMDALENPGVIEDALATDCCQSDGGSAMMET
eukprot:jgi/Ulvmu1/3005/UM015_0045.1